MKIKHLFALFFVINFLNAQDIKNIDKHKILKVTYTAFPISTYDTPPEDSDSYKNHSEIFTLAQSYKHVYTLYINLKSNQSIYKLDTLIINKPAGKEKFNYQINDNLEFVVKNQSKNYVKYEKIFQREFFSEGQIEDIEWQITDEVKEIAGLKCRKAIPKDKNLLLNVWFTEKINVSSGPVNYFGLPGLVVWAEDFFWTTEINSIDYDDSFDFDAEVSRLVKKFDDNKARKLIKEGLLIEKKNKLVRSMIEQMNSK